jgi:hypothetical protein
MCTVTYIPVREAVFLTSNRDEKNWRTPALVPDIYPFRSGKILFPKDGDAGGTWIALHENGNAVIFLNGAFVAHTPRPPYRKSRGLILLDIIDKPSPFNYFSEIDLHNIEPFTAVVFENARLSECRWDGNKKHYKELDNKSPHIWSSATLYGPVISDKRSKWFESWINRFGNPSHEDILHFHQFTGDGDTHNDLMMNRDGKVFTVSVTSIHIDTSLTMDYLDVQNGNRFSKEIIPEILMAGK